MKASSGRRAGVPWTGDKARTCAWCGIVLPANAARSRYWIACPQCDVRTTSPVPSEQALAEAYGAWYRPTRGRFGLGGERLLRRTRSALARRIDRDCPPGVVLDVGAGDGTLLDALAGRGRRAVGTERRSTRPDIVETELTDLEGDYAAVVFWHSLEHLRSPRESLRRATTLLARGGVLYVAMPNAASLQARFFGDGWFALDVPRHLVHVPSKALLEELGSLGLRVERTSYARAGQNVFGWLHGLVRALPTSPDLYDAIRRRDAVRAPVTYRRRALALAAGICLLPPALVAAAAEGLVRRGGTVYVEARRV